MGDTEFRAERDVAGGKLYLRRASAEEPWEYNYWERELNVRTAVADGILFSQRLEAGLGGKKFASPEEAVKATQQALGL
jgi:hypothetical protein